MNHGELIALLIVGGGLVGLVAIVGGFLQCRRDRLLTHTERMRALELGRTPVDDSVAARLKALMPGASDDAEAGSSPAAMARKCYSVAMWVGFFGFLFGAQGRGEVAVLAVLATGATCVTSVICGTILAARASAGSGSASGSPYAAYDPKPQGDPDAYDVVGRRG